MYAGVVVMASAVGVLVLGLYALHRLTAVAPDSLIVLPFESGWAPEQHALSRYHVRWYLATLLFLAFDVEMLFMYPWAWLLCSSPCSGHGGRGHCVGSE